MLRLAATLAFLAALAFPGASRAQDLAYAPGYVATTEGDTLRGELALLDDVEKAQRVTFRPADDAAPVTYTYREADAYGYVGGSRFVHRFVYTTPDSTRGTHAFLREVVSGPRSFYVYHADAETDLYFIGGADFPTEGLFVKTWEGRLSSRTRKLWAGTLTRAFQACRPLLDDLGGLRYGERDFTRITVRYNECVDEGYTYTPSARAFRQSSYAFHVGVEGAAGADRLALNEGFAVTAADPDAAAGAFALRGVAFVELKAWPGRWYAVGELGLQKNGAFEPAFVDPLAAYDPVFVTLGLGGQYELPVDPVAPFVRATYVLGWSVAGERKLSRGTEITTTGGFAFTGGLVWDLPVGPALTLGARAEWLDISEEFVYIPFGSKQGRHRVYSAVLGVRF